MRKVLYWLKWVFETNRTDNSTINPTIFDSLDIPNVLLTISTGYWPVERMKRDFSEGEYGYAYLDSANFNSSYAVRKQS